MKLIMTQTSVDQLIGLMPVSDSGEALNTQLLSK